MSADERLLEVSVPDLLNEFSKVVMFSTTLVFPQLHPVEHAITLLLIASKPHGPWIIVFLLPFLFVSLV